MGLVNVCFAGSSKSEGFETMSSTSRPKMGRGIWKSVRGKTAKKGKKKGCFEMEENSVLSRQEAKVLLTRIRVILAHIEGNAERNDILNISRGSVPEDAKEAAQVLVEALANDDTIYLVQSLQRYSCATLGSVVKFTFMSSPEPLIPGRVCRLILNTCSKYAEYLDEKDDEKIEEIGATLERFSASSNFGILEGLCQCLKRLPMPNDELAYIFAPLVLLPKIHMLVDETVPEEELNSNLDLLASADGIIEAMEFMVENAEVLFDSRMRKRALLKKGVHRKPEAEACEVVTADNLSDAFNKFQSDGGDDDDFDDDDVIDSPLNPELDRGDESAMSFRVAASKSRTVSFACDSSTKAKLSGSMTIETISEEDEEAEEEDECSDNEYDVERYESAGSPHSVHSYKSSASENSEKSELNEKIRVVKEKQPVCTATVKFDYAPNEDGEITLRNGETVEVLEIEDDGWWYGRNRDGDVGVFPGIYVNRDDENDETESKHQEIIKKKLAKEMEIDPLTCGNQILPRACSIHVMAMAEFSGPQSDGSMKSSGMASMKSSASSGINRENSANAAIVQEIHDHMMNRLNPSIKEISNMQDLAERTKFLWDKFLARYEGLVQENAKLKAFFVIPNN